MGLSSGARLGPYEIVAPLGAGGMGEVYRARDSKLGRDVAIKVLPEAFACDAERLARFQREATLLASLNHSNIASIYGLEDSGQTHALVMELAEGPTLSDHIAQGPIPIDEALHMARQIAGALEYAHERGVVHRDLKPANIKVAADDSVKILDFGLAKAVQGEAKEASGANSPTVSHLATQAGVLLGTAAYMSPEQAKAKPVDRRADIWAFGCVLYEMLTGKTLFPGETVAETLAAVLKNEPDWTELPKDTPTHVRVLLQRCLQKDCKQRLRDIGDARIALDEILSGAGAVAPGSPPAAESRVRTPALQRALPWALAAATTTMAIVAVVLLWRATRPVEQPLTRLDVNLGPEAMPGLNLTVAISPDGRRLVFPVHGPGGKPQLATRLLDQARATVLAGTEGGTDPFFSPDGQWIGFFTDRQLMKISVQGGAPVKLGTTSRFPEGGDWGEDGNIVAAMGHLSPLSRIPAAGGPDETLTKLGPGEITHRWPQIVPGGAAVLFTGSASTAGYDNASIEALSLKTGQVKTLVRGGYYGRYLPSGHLVYLHQGVLFGVGFDLERLEVRGAPTPLLEDVAANATTGGGEFDFSTTGTFVYAAGKSAAQSWQFAWLDTSGKISLLGPPGTGTLPHLSPDGRKLAYVGDGPDIYIYDMDRDTTTRLTFSGHAVLPVWAPDGKHLVFRTTQGDKNVIYWARSDGAGEPQQLLESTNAVTPWSISPDGRWLAYHETTPDSTRDLWTLPLDLTDAQHPKPGKPEPFLRTPADEAFPRFSPDGRWIAYRSDESGNVEVYVRPFPAASGGKWQVSAVDGGFAFWANNGRELFYETHDNRIMVVDYRVEGDSFVPGKPRLWSDKQLFSPGTLNLDLAPDGKRFVVLALPETPAGEKDSVHVTMLLNFFDELKRRIPPGK